MLGGPWTRDGESQGSHAEVNPDGSKMKEGGGSGGHQPPFPEW